MNYWSKEQIGKNFQLHFALGKMLSCALILRTLPVRELTLSKRS